ncbi:hypothetical protein K435DRAFT_683546, partial [Dendrothele bispora CBS 962.96]
KSSGYIGRNWTEGPGKIWTLEEMVGPDSVFKFQLLKWDGKTSIPLVDDHGRIFAILVGHPPNDPTWELLNDQAVDLLEKYRGLVTPDDKVSRRGLSRYMSVGYSFGGGQKIPQPLLHNCKDQRILEDLLSAECFQRLSGHLSSAFATWAPKLHQVYMDTLSSYEAHDPSFHRNFPGTAFAAATFNFDEQTETMEHVDYFNYITGWCGITALGHFNHTKGAQMILWDLKLVIEFPPVSSMLIPSCFLRHSNTAVPTGETRQSFTEFSAGGLFRYKDDEMRTRVSMSNEERKQKETEARESAREAVNIYSTFKELADTVLS